MADAEMSDESEWQREEARKALEAARQAKVSLEMSNLKDASTGRDATSAPDQTPGYGNSVNPIEPMNQPAINTPSISAPSASGPAPGGAGGGGGD